MKYLAVLLVLTVSLCHSVTTVSALYDPRTLPNNKLGVHLLNPSEIESAASLVNSQGGDWGYVTVPIQPTDRDKSTWQTFMNDAKEHHLIPIVRITTIPQGGTWQIIGVGGVTVPKDFREYRDAGADVVMSATGAMWNSYLAKEIKEAYPDA